MIGKIIRRSFLKRFDLPLNLILHITSKCSYSCKFCFVKKRPDSVNEELSLGEMERISKGLKNLICLNISGGEPFMREDLAEICEIFHKNSAPGWISIPTNGAFPDRVEVLCEKIFRKIDVPVSIEVSLDGIGEKHDRIRNFSGAFDKALITYEILKSLRKKYHNLYIKILTVVNEDNIDCLDEIAEYVRMKKEDIFLHTFIFARTKSSKGDLVLFDKSRLLDEELILKLKERSEAFSSGKPHLFFNSAVEFVRQKVLAVNLATIEKNRQIIPCLAGKIEMVIWANADVSFCELGDVIGNLRKYDFEVPELLGSEKSNEVRKKITRDKCFCTHECVVFDNILFDIKNYPLIAFEAVKMTAGDFFRQWSWRN